MAFRCEICHKGQQYGHNVSHSKHRSKRVFKPNLHLARVGKMGQRKKMKLCSKCLKNIKYQILNIK